MTIDPTTQAIHDDLPREVLSYVEGLRRQMYAISRKYGVEKPADIGPKMASGEMSLADMDRMIELKTLLERALETKRISAAELRNLAQSKVQRKQDILESMRGLAELAVELDRNSRIVDFTKPLSWSPELERAVDRLTPFLPEELLNNQNLMAEVTIALLPYLPPHDRGLGGLVASMVMNRSIRELPEEVRAGATQRIVGRGKHDVGYGWLGGTLIVKGDVGEGLGREMAGGIIRSEQAGDNLGARMRGGKIVVHFTDKEPLGVGQHMEGGTIKMGAAGDLLGLNMRGGTILVEKAGNGAGEHMQGGSITISKSAGNDVGRMMEGGTIVVAHARTSLGFGMIGGKIVADACSDAGTEMSGGMIVAKDATISAGARMTGGQIDVGETTHAGFDMSDGLVRVLVRASTVGHGMTDGSIEIHGTAFGISKKRAGGKIRYVGKGAWWKNLWI